MHLCILSFQCLLQRLMQLKCTDCSLINTVVHFFISDSRRTVHTFSQESLILTNVSFTLLVSAGRLHQSITRKVSRSWQVSAADCHPPSLRLWLTYAVANGGVLYFLFSPMSPKLPQHCGSTHSSPSGARGTPAQD